MHLLHRIYTQTENIHFDTLIDNDFCKNREESHRIPGQSIPILVAARDGVSVCLLLLAAHSG